MRVCHIFPQFRSLAGGERLMIKVANLLLGKGHKVIILTLSINKECGKEINKDVQLIVSNQFLERLKGHYPKVFFEHLFVYRLAKLIPQGVDLVVFHKSSSLPALFYYKRILRSKTPSHYFCYEPPRFLYDLKPETMRKLGIGRFFLLPLYPLLRFFDRRFVQAADSILVFSHFMEKEVERLYQRKARMVGPLGFDLRPEVGEKAYLSQYGVREGDKVLLTVNRLQPRKRLHILIEALPLIVRDFPNVKALIIGTGPEEKNLRRLAKERNLEDFVRFVGYVEEERLPIFYSLADIYIHLAKNEPFGLSVLEALSFGKPVISVREGGPEEIIREGEFGLFTLPSATDLAEKVLYLLRGEKVRLEMGRKAGFEIQRRYNWEDFLARFLLAVQSNKGEFC